MKTLTDILLETQRTKRKYFKNYKFFCQKIKEIAREILKEVRVLVFGSIVKGEWKPDSDIDILIISKNLPQNPDERAKIRTKIKSKIDSLSPFQIHLSTPEEFERWHKNFIKGNYWEI